MTDDGRSARAPPVTVCAVMSSEKRQATRLHICTNSCSTGQYQTSVWQSDGAAKSQSSITSKEKFPSAAAVLEGHINYSLIFQQCLYRNSFKELELRSHSEHMQKDVKWGGNKNFKKVTGSDVQDTVLSQTQISLSVSPHKRDRFYF